ncbi:MAG: tetratricopeptide repeat protein, partial [Deltaproteobacteria bacterium]
MTRSASIGIGLLMLVVAATGAAAPGVDLYDRALAMYRAGRHAEAIAILREKPAPDGGDLSLLGWALLKSGNARDAKARFEQSIALDPRSSDPHCGLGYAHLRMELPAEALGNFDRGLALDRANDDCRTGKALAVKRMGRGAPSARTAASATPAGRTAAEAADRSVSVFARGRYFWIGTSSRPPRPVYVNGVNLGFGLPGKYPVEFPEGERTYLEWFGNVRKMNANVLRVYTILPPGFYRALKAFNRGRGITEKLFLIQGIWTELPEGGDFRDPDYLKQVTG